MGLLKNSSASTNPRLVGLTAASEIGRLGVIIEQNDELLAEQRRTNQLLAALLERQAPPPHL